MSVKNSTQSLTRNQSNTRALTAARSDALIYDSATDPFYNKVVVNISDSDYSTNILEDRSGNHWDSYYGFTGYSTSDSRIPVYNGPRYKNWCSSFWGDGGYYTYSDTPSLRLGYFDFVIEFWIKPMRNHGVQHHVMAKGTGAATAAGTGWVIGINSTYNIFFGYGITTDVLTSNYTLPQDQWTHVAFARTSPAIGGLKIYINGTLNVTSSVATPAYTDTAVFRIGRDRDATAGTHFGGRITDIRIQTNGILQVISATDANGSITVPSTSGFVTGQRVIFSGTPQGGLIAGTTYYVQSIVDSTHFTVSATSGGSTYFTTVSTTGMTANILTYTAATPTLPTAALSMTGTNVMFASSMTELIHPNQFGTLTLTTNVHRRIDSPFLNKSTMLTGHGSHSVATYNTDSALKIYDVQSPGNASLRLGTVFTVEAWVFGTSGIGSAFCGKGTSGWTFKCDGTRLVWYDNLTTLTANVNSTTKMYYGAWYHVAAVRTSTAADGFKMYVNGALAYTGTLATDYSANTEYASLFSNRTLGEPIAGMMTGIKWSNVARYAPTAVQISIASTDATGVLSCSDSTILQIGQQVIFTGTAVSGITNGTTYYVLTKPGIYTFTVSASLGGTRVSTAATFSNVGLVATLNPQFDVTTTAFLDTQMSNDANTLLLVGTVGTGTVVINTNAFIDKGQNRQAFWRKSNESRLPAGSNPSNRHGHCAWFPNSAQNLMKATPASGNPNDFTFGTGNFSIELWSNTYEQEGTMNQFRVLLDTRFRWNDTGIIIRRSPLLGVDVLTSGRKILTSPREGGMEPYTTNDRTKFAGDVNRVSGPQPPNSWYHICVQRVGNVIALYINGRKVSETYYTAAINSPAGKIWLGGSEYSNALANINYDTNWYGWMSDVRVCKGSAAYGDNVSMPDTIPVPTAPLPTITNCVLLTFCQGIVGDYSGRKNIVGYEQTYTNGGSTWEVKQCSYSPYSGVDWDLTTQINGNTGPGDSNSNWYSSGGNNNYNTTNQYSDYSFITRMSGAWTIEGFFYTHQTGNADRTISVSAWDVFYTANTAGHEGFQLLVNYNDAGGTTFGDLTLVFRTANAPTTQYLGTTNALGVNQGAGWWIPYSWVHFAFQYDPSKTNKMAVFINGVRAAVRAAFTPGQTNWNTYALTSGYKSSAGLRISNTARYNNDATTYTVPTQQHVQDQYTITQIETVNTAISERTYNVGAVIYGCHISHYYKKFGNGSIKVGGRDALPSSLSSFNLNKNYSWCTSDALGSRWGDYTFELWAAWQTLANGGKAFATTGYGNFLFCLSDHLSVGINQTGYWKFQHVPSHTDAQHWIYNVGQGVAATSQTPNTTAGYGYQLFQSNVLVAQPTATTPNVFDHIVVMRKNGNQYWYINGVEMCQLINNNFGSYGGADNIHYAPINNLTQTDYVNLDHDIGHRDGADATSWCGWLQDIRYTHIARYDTIVINGVPTMVHKNTKIPALPTKILPTK